MSHHSECFCDHCCAKRNAVNKAYNTRHAAGRKYGENTDQFYSRLMKNYRKDMNTKFNSGEY